MRDRPISKKPFEDELCAYELVHIANFMQITHSLPRSGGLLDQDSYLMLGITMVYSIQNRVSSEGNT